MTSNHYAMTYSHEYNWLILIAISLAGALVRVYFVARHKGSASPIPVILAALILMAVAAAIAPRPRAASAGPVTLDMIRPVVQSRCTSCHSAEPTHIAFPAAPAGVMLDTDVQIIAEAARIYQQTVVLKAMPIGNLTAMTDAERALIDAWYRTEKE
jgi:uncharacterized membrane protein